MAKSRKTEKQQLLKDYEAFLQEEKAEEERLQREEDEFWFYQLEHAHYLYEQEMEDRRLGITDDFNADYEYCWPDYDPYFWVDDE